MTTTLIAPADGLIVPLEKVPDAVFSGGMMGPGFAVEPVATTLVAPAKAKVVAVAPSQHAVTLELECGAQILIHLGIDTVALKGEGVNALVRAGDVIEAGAPLLCFDIDALAGKAKSLCTPIILLDREAFALTLNAEEGVIRQGEAIGDIVAKAPGSAQDEADAAQGEIETLHGVTQLSHGLHARPAAALAQAAKAAGGNIAVSANGATARADSVSALLRLGLEKGDRITLEISKSVAGEARQAVLKALDFVEQDDDAPSSEPAPCIAEEIIEKISARSEFSGLTASTGLAIGKARLLAGAVADDGKAQGDPSEEAAALTHALEAAREAIAAEQETAGEVGAEILQAHLVMLSDPSLVETAQAAINKGQSAAGAWRGVIDAEIAALESSSVKRLAERADDMRDIGERVAGILTGGGDAKSDDLAGAIIVAKDLLPSQFIRLQGAGIAGIALARGGVTSHVALMATARSVPMLVGLGEALAGIENGAPVMLDAARQRFIALPTADDVSKAQARAQKRSQLNDGAAARRHETAVVSGAHVTVLANLAEAGDEAGAVEAGAEGCGLLRTEFLFMKRMTPPTEDEQYKIYCEMATGLGDRPFTIRTLDIGADKAVPFLDMGHEENPALGARGIRMIAANGDLLATQLRALLRAAQEYPIKIMAPMVNDPGDADALLAMVDEELKALGLAHRPLIGAMVETPSSALLIDQLMERLDFVSIGSNDLTQYALAMDREHPELARRLDGVHPAVLRLIASVARIGKVAPEAVSLCGGLAADPCAIPLLVGAGLRQLSAPVSRVAMTKEILRGLEISDCEELLDEALAVGDAKAVRALVMSRMPTLEDWG